MRFHSSQPFSARGENSDGRTRNAQAPGLSGLIGAVWQPVTAVTVVLAICYTQIMFLQTMSERF